VGHLIVLEDDLIMISVLQHFVFSPHLCALIHIEQIWTESGRTADGRIMHERVHDESDDSMQDIERAHP
jgi:CRISPR-associated exonuclease Cas4